jgi:hypothetical protein
MTPINVVQEWLQSIPSNVRKYILLSYALATVLTGILSVAGVDLDYAKITAVLTIIGGYLGFQSAANVPAPGEGARQVGVEPDRPPVAPQEDPNAH